jgi:predicted lipid-binding transport protein (Tim44 family)
MVTLPAGDQSPMPALPRNVTLSGDDVERGIAEIARADRTFDISRFIGNVQDAFVMIVEAFAAGDRETLRDLLEPQVYGAFDKAIQERESAGQVLSTEIHAVRKIEFLKATADQRETVISIRFVADETCVARDRDGKILSGDPDRITEMNDIWTFVRPLKSRDPIWLLRETRDGDVKEEHKTPVPDAG